MHPATWRIPDFALPVAPAMTVRLARDAMQAAFLVTTTSFSAPQQITLEELRIESCFPLDDATRALCRQLAVEGDMQP